MLQKLLSELYIQIKLIDMFKQKWLKAMCFYKYQNFQTAITQLIYNIFPLNFEKMFYL